jgi:hypothetical protein
MPACVFTAGARFFRSLASKRHNARRSGESSLPWGVNIYCQLGAYVHRNGHLWFSSLHIDDFRPPRHSAFGFQHDDRFIHNFLKRHFVRHFRCSIDVFSAQRWPPRGKVMLLIAGPFLALYDAAGRPRFEGCLLKSLSAAANKKRTRRLLRKCGKAKIGHLTGDWLRILRAFHHRPRITGADAGADEANRRKVRITGPKLAGRHALTKGG